MEDKVVDSRLADGGAATRRRRECLGCGRRYTTFERIEEAMSMPGMARFVSSQPQYSALYRLPEREVQASAEHACPVAVGLDGQPAHEVVRGRRQPAAEPGPEILESADVVTLPAMQRDGDLGQPPQRGVDIHAELRVSLLGTRERPFD